MSCATRAASRLPQTSRGLRPARLIINPNSGSFAKQVESPEKLVAMLRAHGIQAEVYLKDLQQGGAQVGARGGRQ